MPELDATTILPVVESDGIEWMTIVLSPIESQSVTSTCYFLTPMKTSSDSSLKFAPKTMTS